jgi:hypothetical protein
MNIARTLHESLKINDNKTIENILNELTLDNISDNGILTNIILYFINNNDTRLDIIINNTLMKRDYIKLAIYYYHSDLIKSLYIFNKNTHELEMKDINGLINNKCYELIKLLNGVYLQTNIQDDLYEKYYDNMVNFDYNLINIKNTIEQHINIKELNKFNKFINKYNYDYIIDGCNVLLYHGKISNKNINNLYKIINTKQRALVIIHTKYIKQHPNIKKKLDELNILYYLTPYLHNDDYFILLAFLKSRCFIISNDKYRDHIFLLKSKHLLHNKILEFNYSSVGKENKLNMCIQVNENIYIPHINNYLIKI